MSDDRKNTVLKVYHYHQAVAPMLWVLLGLSLIELLVMHFLISFWSEIAAIILSVITFISIVWLVRFLLSLKKYPVLLTYDSVVMRIGNRQSYTVPIADIAKLRTEITADALKGKDVANLALLAHPNLMIDLKAGRTRDGAVGKHQIMKIAHRLDNIELFLSDFNQQKMAYKGNEQ
ncbi:hypothetical protein ACR9YC_06470 [Parasphingorhabdus sp. DH2-15]|uniref:hypothetical protein n=1 Tax=Parasphingorhabdus sp. DH2-15 TaxID=3444112 RepID=UPI003F68793F